jgi:hypothetical protein
MIKIFYYITHVKIWTPNGTTAQITHKIVRINKTNLNCLFTQYGSWYLLCNDIFKVVNLLNLKSNSLSFGKLINSKKFILFIFINKLINSIFISPSSSAGNHLLSFMLYETIVTYVGSWSKRKTATL